LLFDADDRAKLGDFALLRTEDLNTLHNITRAGTVPGEQVYQAPEVVSGRGVPTPACDVYGLAACLYEAVTGFPPIKPAKDNLPEQINRIMNETPPRADAVRRDVPADLAQVLDRALKKRPAERYASAREFAEELRAVATGLLTGE
jgi:serine/threonine protein kinase